MQPHISSACQVADADRLLERFGETAMAEARRRAGISRNLGNHVHFCRWRQVERLVAVLASERAPGTVH